MLFEFSKAISPSKIAQLESFKCPIKDLDFFFTTSTSSSGEIQAYKEEIGRDFEKFVFTSYKEADEIIDFSTLEVDCLDNAKEKLDEILEEGKTYLFHNYESNGIALKRKNLDIDVTQDITNLDSEDLKDLKNLIEKRGSVDNQYIYLDGFLTKKKDGKIYIKVVEVKSSKEVQKSHIFQALWYAVALENCFKDFAVIEDEIEIITRSLASKYKRNNIKVASKIKSLFSFLESILKRVQSYNEDEMPPLNQMCESCNKINDCFIKSVDKKSIFLLKSIKKEVLYLNKKGYKEINSINEDIHKLEDTILISPFKVEAEIVNNQGFYKDLSRLPEANSSTLTLKIPKSIVGFTLIPNPIYHVPLALSVFFYGKNIDISSIFNNYEENTIGDFKFSSFIIYPTKEHDLEKYENYILELLFSMFEFLKELETEISVLYFDDKSKRALSSFLFYHLKKSKKIEDLISAYKASSFSDSLEMEGYKETGFILQEFLLLNGAMTNEPYNFKLSGIRSLGNKLTGSFKFNYIPFSNTPLKKSITIDIDDSKILEVQKYFWTPLSEVISQEIKVPELFKYKENYSFYLKPDKEIPLIEYLSLINFETAGILKVGE